MTLNELAEALPNGLHDALLHGYEVDLERRAVVLEVSLLMGDLRDTDPLTRERRERTRLVLEGVRFFHVERPAPGYPYAGSRPARVDVCEPDPNHPLSKEQPAGVFVARLFVEEWNAFIHLAAEGAELAPLAHGGS
jgi:hypothetical protein